MQALKEAANLSRFISSHPLTKEKPFGAWWRIISWQVRSRMADEVVCNWIEGQKLAVRRGMRGATGNIYAGLHEFVDMMLPLHLLRSGDLFLDVGANIGSYTVLASGVRGATTWAFEPDPGTVRALERNVELNNLGDKVTIHPLALGEIDGTVAFTQGLDTVNRVVCDGEANARRVVVRRLDSLVGERQPLLIKMDVEGYEQSVVRGAQHLLAADGLRVMTLETVTSEIDEFMAKHGFVRAYYDPFHRALTTTSNGQQASNAIYVRDWDFVASRLTTAPAVNVLGRSI
jgi:FkbM family methyltransferase